MYAHSAQCFHLLHKGSFYVVYYLFRLGEYFSHSNSWGEVCPLSCWRAQLLELSERGLRSESITSSWPSHRASISSSKFTTFPVESADINTLTHMSLEKSLLVQRQSGRCSESMNHLSLRIVVKSWTGRVWRKRITSIRASEWCDSIFSRFWYVTWVKTINRQSWQPAQLESTQQ